MNSRLHEEFVALTALFYSGDITDEEWALLQVHLAYCDACRQAFEQYQQVTADVVPAMAAVAAESERAPVESERAFQDAEKRLMGQLDSVAPRAKEEPPAKSGWRVLPGALAAGLIVAGALACVHYVRTKDAPPTVASVHEAAQPLPLPQVQPQRQQISSLEEDVKQKDQELATLEQQVQAEKRKSEQSEAEIAKVQRQLHAEQDQAAQLQAQRDQLSQQLVDAKTEMQALHVRVASLETAGTQRTTQTAELESRVNNLKAALDEANTALDAKDRMLSLDKDFLSHDRDIRDLIGARNLYIADIFDTNADGKTAKPFGRIFYTKDRSLVFYGFDLEHQAGLKQPVAFQVWGSGTDKPPVSLGIFYQDDSHKRWVLRCNDAKTLERLNMVFVTVEPPGGSSKPTGKQLLRAYLQIPSNHP